MVNGEAEKLFACIDLAKNPRDFIADGGGQEPATHHERAQIRGRHLIDQGEAHRRQAQFARRNQEVRADQPPCRRLFLAVFAGHRRQQHNADRARSLKESQADLRRCGRLHASRPQKMPKSHQQGCKENNKPGINRIKHFRIDEL